MRRVHAILFDLHPVAGLDKAVAGIWDAAWHLEYIVDRKGRLLVGRAHVGEYEAFVLEDWVGPMPQPLFQRAVCWLTGSLEDLSVYVHEPAVVAAANSFLAYLGELQGRAAVRAVELQQAHSAAPIAKYHEILSHYPDVLGHVVQLGGDGNRLPETAEVLTARCPRADVGQLLIFLWQVAVEVSSVGDI